MATHDNLLLKQHMYKNHPEIYYLVDMMNYTVKKANEETFERVLKYLDQRDRILNRDAESKRKESVQRAAAERSVPGGERRPVVWGTVYDESVSLVELESLQKALRPLDGLIPRSTGTPARRPGTQSVCTLPPSGPLSSPDETLRKWLAPTLETARAWRRSARRKTPKGGGYERTGLRVCDPSLPD